MIETGEQNPAAFHLAGIVPVAGQPLDFNMPWHDSLMPIGKNYLAVERAVLECAWAGSETIWIVCHREMQSLIKSRIGEWVYDPNSLLEKGVFSSQKRRRVPIYYVPIHPKDRDRRDCLGWSVLYGALSAYHISRKMSKWLVPDKFYCAFPYGIYNPELLKNFRRQISRNGTFCLTHEGNSVITGEYLGFTFDGEDFKRCRRRVRKEGTVVYDSDGKLVPAKKRWSARNFSLDKVFSDVIIDVESKNEIESYHRVDSWDGLRQYLSSNQVLTKPEFFKPKKWNKVGGESED